MSDYTTTMPEGSNQAIAAADDLYRIHCYADTLAKLCASSSSINIRAEQLEQIFKDIAVVTDKGAARLYTAIDSIKALDDFAQRNLTNQAGPPAPATSCTFSNHNSRGKHLRPEVINNESSTPDQIKPPYIKSHKIMGKTERIYIPEYVDVEGKETADILQQGVIIPKMYDNHTVNDFSLWLCSKDSFKEIYYLVPRNATRKPNEDENSFYKRVGIKVVRECKQV